MREVMLRTAAVAILFLLGLAVVSCSAVTPARAAGPCDRPVIVWVNQPAAYAVAGALVIEHRDGTGQPRVIVYVPWEGGLIYAGTLTGCPHRARLMATVELRPPPRRPHHRGHH